MNSSSTVLAEIILQDAIDFIGNSPTQFGADRHAIDTIINNEDFRKTVIDEITSCPDDYSELSNSQEDAANFVWRAYKKWAYGG